MNLHGTRPQPAAEHGPSLQRSGTTRLPPRHRQQGVALVVVLWLLVLMSVIAASHARNIRIETKLAANQVESTRARALAEAGVNHAILELLVQDPSQRWLTDGTTYRLALDGGIVDVAVRDTRGLIDLNTVDALLLDKVLTALGLDEIQRAKLIGATLDWRDADSLKHDNGAEDDDYQLAGMQWGVRDGAFGSIEEYRYVLGMTNSIFEQLAPYLIVGSNHRRINPDYAPPWLLGVLNATQDESAPTPPVTAPRRSVAHGIYKITLKATTERGATTSLDVVVQIKPAAKHAYTIISWREPSWSTPGDPG